MCLEGVLKGCFECWVQRVHFGRYMCGYIKRMCSEDVWVWVCSWGCSKGALGGCVHNTTSTVLRSYYLWYQSDKGLT